MRLPDYLNLLEYAAAASQRKGAPMLTLSAVSAAQDDAELTPDERRQVYARALNVFALVHGYWDEHGPPMRTE